MEPAEATIGDEYTFKVKVTDPRGSSIQPASHPVSQPLTLTLTKLLLELS